MPFDASKIKEFRKKLGATQTELGVVLGVPQSTVGRWETQQTFPNVFHISLMCDLGHCHGIEPGFFFPNFSHLNIKKEA
jgi:DNA-binding XRE family transcriptional regulator